MEDNMKNHKIWNNYVKLCKNKRVIILLNWFMAKDVLLSAVDIHDWKGPIPRHSLISSADKMITFLSKCLRQSKIHIAASDSKSLTEVVNISD